MKNIVMIILSLVAYEQGQGAMIGPCALLESSYSNVAPANQNQTLNNAPFTQFKGVGGTVDYDMSINPNNGWYSEPHNPYKFKLGFKQGERDSASPVEVATIGISETEKYGSYDALQMQIIARREMKPHSTAAYKVSISSVKPGDSFNPSIFESKDWFHGFAMKIDPVNFHIQSGNAVMFQEFWQGSPFGPPVSLQMITKEDAEARGWQAGPYGNFGLVLADDEHGSLASLGTKPQYFDLGHVELGTWMRWIVRFRPSPINPNGEVQVWVNSQERILLQQVKVGFNPAHPQYKVAKTFPSDRIQDVDTLIYRLNGDNFQRLFFANIKLAGTFEAANPLP